MAFRKPPCPICGDPNAFPLWIDDADPPMCPVDPAWERDGPEAMREVRSVAECPKQMGKARQRAEWMKVAPDCFGADGALLDGKLGEVLERWSESHDGNPPPLWLG